MGCELNSALDTMNVPCI